MLLLRALQVFAPAFRRNARWSIDPKVPDVGDESSSWEAVSAFYDFWYGFKSWREFPHPDEEDVEGAESREHKRWIERCVPLVPSECLLHPHVYRTSWQTTVLLRWL
jgi:hypothetical protein